jgi:hypothetical protein
MIVAAVLLAELAAWGLLHRSEEELTRAFREGSTTRRLEALHVLTNRGEIDPSSFGPSFVANLLADPDTRLREAAFTNEVCRLFAPPMTQSDYSRDPSRFTDAELDHWWRSYVIHRRKVGGAGTPGEGGLRLQRQELAWFLDAMEGRPLDRGAISGHLRERIEQTRPGPGAR